MTTVGLKMMMVTWKKKQADVNDTDKDDATTTGNGTDDGHLQGIQETINTEGGGERGGGAT